MMRNRENSLPSNGECWANQANTVGTNHVSNGSILYPMTFVNPQMIPVAAGGVVNWAVCDALHTLKAELLRRGLVRDDDELAEAIRASWQTMVTQASYFPVSELEALEVGRG